MSKLNFTSRRASRLTLALVAAAGAVAIPAASSAHEEDRGKRGTLIKTRLTIDHKAQASMGIVRNGSYAGGAAFCRGGKFRDEVTEEEPVFTLVKRFRCRDGVLRIQFQPQGHGRTQSGPWKVLGGSGKYEGLSGNGWMTVRFQSERLGRETFAGTMTM